MENAEPELFRVVVELKDYSAVVTEPTTLDGAEAELERLFQLIRFADARDRMVRVGTRAVVLGSSIRKAQIMRAWEVDDEDE